MTITRVKCLVPFFELSVHHLGYCYSCCPCWTKYGDVGRLNAETSVMDIWNNEKMQYIRQAIFDDELGKICNFEYCPHAIKNEYIDLEAAKKEDDIEFNQIIDQIMMGKTILDTAPYSFSASNSGKCNLLCIMCISNDKLVPDDEVLDEQLYTKIIPEILPKIPRLLLSGNGEVFFNRNSLRFLQSLDSKNYPSLKIQLFTNGTMFTPKLWETIKHNHFEFIAVSIDAASPKTYEKIRKNGKWKVLRRNLEFIATLRRQKVFSYFRINFCVMKSNYREMKDFVKLGLSLGCDDIFFQKIYDDTDIRENINLTQNIKVMVEIGKILADPIFSRPEVTTTLIDDYRKYGNKRVSIRDRFHTLLIEWREIYRKRFGKIKKLKER